ncbi:MULTISPECIES: D-alanyl-D-alanine carboxypeptidase/D-alanyl-D-alanine endopeptidase [Streptomyces]|uniref:D-alanyl-D-alanine carboxypeptidase/D-alanyl-D-alanine-endopeptidase n=1 Tax=Streptomyces dengpaensis TaxID=2049881 RepID=A0ABM6SRZ0_9ACTN|nr:MULTISPECIES: D-alanyl-D-alanine carboxypeptidase/D-alanyl-D-alanine-endopeptidase [Streptomyces]AVH57331.1 D-alanyl-D-alanine carboxypeptidase/D-alanyl-D-alanine-endopeptidase [Streptomyces dengpaensis]PIB05345.1 D-alanyl-D-alanine carboxypeptidase/D-alanyl-D-alanine-endopeptidase [Streptomyces sp. HG99]
MVVPELRAWRAARPHVVRVARTVKPHVARITQAVRPPSVRLTTPQVTAIAATVGLALAAGAVAAAGPWDSTGQRTAERDWAASQEGEGGADHGRRSDTSQKPAQPQPAPSAASVLARVGGSASAVPAPAEKALADVLDPLLDKAAVLGARRTAVVVDVATGKRLYGKGADEVQIPASTTKIATAVAALSATGPEHRIKTRTVLEPDTKEVVLVGGGDPTLTAEKDADGWASLHTLADRTATALKDRHMDRVTLSYDTSLYAGPALHPIGVNDNIAQVTSLMVDEGRSDDSTGGPAARVPDPAADAARQFADLLHDRGIKTTNPGPSKATNRAEALASVSSAPLSALVERMLTNSDNDIAEALARQVALASGEQPSFEGDAKAMHAQLKKLGLPLSGTNFADGSGLNRADRLSADLLTALLAKAGDPAHPELRPVLTGLPVAGFTGTLSTRYSDDPAATGVVRAKTGTLTGVNTLAGTVVNADGRLLAFAFLASDEADPPNTVEARAALDHAATALAACGCR